MPHQDDTTPRTTWSSERTFILTTTAAAVGLGNLWRFPYITGVHGGAAFILAYLIAIIILGFPLMVLELSLGRNAKGSPVAAFRQLHPYARYFGWLVVGLTALIMSYYLVVTGWTLGYTLKSLNGTLESFDQFSQSYLSVWDFLIVLTIISGILLAGVRGIERAALWLMPPLFFLVIVLAIFGLTLHGTPEALRFLFAPDFRQLGDPQLWLFAAGQAFYSLAVGQGYLITYGSHLPKRVNLVRAAGAVAGIETLIALLAGIMIFPIVFSFGFAPGKGSHLVFNTLPAAFAIMPFGRTLATGFFLLFFAAALSSCIAGMNVVVTAVREEFRLTQAKAVLYTALPIGLLGVLSALSATPIQLSIAGRPFLEVIDLFAATQVIVLASTLGGTLICWLVPRERLLSAVSEEWRELMGWTIRAGRYTLIPVLVLFLWFS